MPGHRLESNTFFGGTRGDARQSGAVHRELHALPIGLVNLLLSLTCWCSEHKRSKAALGVELVPCARPSALLVAASTALAAVARALRALSIAMVGFVFAIRVRGRSRAVPSEKVKRLSLDSSPTCLIFSKEKSGKLLLLLFLRARAVAEESRRQRALGERGERGEGGRT